ncbi:MAG: sugar phosphorylase, partial [Pseudomonadota bacterium]
MQDQSTFPDNQTSSKLPGLSFPTQLVENAQTLLQLVYPGQDVENLTQIVLKTFWPGAMLPRKRGRTPSVSLWSQKDSYLITYGNSFVDGEFKPLDLLHDFVKSNLSGFVSGVHILPYFPFTSDDGFAITDYREVNSALGSWDDIGRIADEFTLMSDLVINHCSSQSKMFSDYRQGHEPYAGYFFEASPDDDLSCVVRPRAHPLLREVETVNGAKHVWCTFSHDQVDFDFSNPTVLLEFLDILRCHIEKGVRTVRLDAIAFLWKEPGTTSIHLPQTHNSVRLLRLLVDYNEDAVILITETNVPNAENLSYFGNRNEAHAVYNFPLPPLLLHGLLNGTSHHLNAWQMSMPPAQLGCTYFNFTASHDGIGVRPAEGFLSDEEIDQMIETVTDFGGRVSMRETADKGLRPYEINVSLFDALGGTVKGTDGFQKQRFLCGQIIAMGLEGIPAFYVHSLLATPNDHEGVERMGYNRAINRHRWQYPELKQTLAEPTSNASIILGEMKRILSIRKQQSAFHPNATQFTLQLGDKLFGFWRQSMDRAQSIFAIHNLSAEPVSIPAMSLNLIGGDQW